MDMTALTAEPEFGSFAAVAKVCDLSREAVRKWTRVPPEHCRAIEEFTGGRLRADELRPDVEFKRDAEGRVTGYLVEIGPRTEAA